MKINMVDNFEQIKKLLKFESEDDFYFCQVFRRKKDNPGMVGGRNNSDRSIKNFYITSIEKLDLYKEEMIDLAKITNSRVGINLNRRSFKKVALLTIKNTADYIYNNDYKSVKKAFSSACGTCMNEPNKKWIIDIDQEYINLIDECTNDIYALKPSGSKFIDLIPTKSGFHIITKPFDLSLFKTIYHFLDVHRDNPTILYIP